MADTLQQLLRTRAEDEAVAVKYGEDTWTWRQHIADAGRQAAVLIALADPQRPLHVAALLGNTPRMLTALAAAGLGGYVLCGINTTRRGDALARDIAKVDTQILLTDADHRYLIDGLDLPGVTVIDTTSAQWAELLDTAPALARIASRAALSRAQPARRHQCAQRRRARLQLRRREASHAGLRATARMLCAKSQCSSLSSRR